MNQHTKYQKILMAVVLALSCSGLVAAPEAMVKKGSKKVRVMNATPDHIVFALLPTQVTLTGRYTKLYGNFDYLLYELLPGQLIDLPNFASSLTKYDSAIWVANIKQKNALESAIQARELKDKKNITAIAANAEVVRVGYDKNDKPASIKEDRAREKITEYLSVGNAVAQSMCGKSIKQEVKTS